MNTAELDRRGKSARGLEIRQQGRLASQTERSYRNKFLLSFLLAALCSTLPLAAAESLPRQRVCVGKTAAECVG